MWRNAAVYTEDTNCPLPLNIKQEMKPFAFAINTAQRDIPGSHFGVGAAFDVQLRPVDQSASAASAIRPGGIVSLLDFDVYPESASCEKRDRKTH